MMRVLALLGVLSLAGCATTAGSDWTRFSDASLNAWLDEQAIPGLSRTFSQHPRFKAETIRIAALDGEQVAGRSNGFTTAVRDALHAALMDQPGLDIVLVEGPQTCTMTPIDGYYLAVEAKPSGSRGANIQLRLYDIVEQQWISGFGHQWRGDLSSAQSSALQRPVIAETARGLRVLPFTADQSDLLAERLAADLACQLKRSGDDELVVQPVRDRAAALIAGNLAGKHRIPVAADGALVLETRVHKVDQQLYQVWALLTPDPAATAVSAITASAYATGPLLKAATTPRPASPIAVPASVPAAVTQPELLSGLSVIATANGDDCGHNRWQHRAGDLGDRPVIAANACFGLEFARHPRAHIYVFSHQVNGSLKRLHPSGCRRAAVDKRAAVVRFPANAKPLQWDARTGTETLYVIATHGRPAAARVDRLIRRLPDDCGADDHDQPANAGWLNEIDSAIRALDDDVAWEAVRVYHQPRTGVRTAVTAKGARR